MDLIYLIIIASLVVFAAFLIRSMVGFANSLIIVPLLSIFMKIDLVIGVAGLFSLIGGGILYFHTKKQIKKEFIPVFIFVLIGTFIGTHFLVSYSTELLEGIMGGVIILFSVPIMLNKTFDKVKKTWGCVAGFLSGIFGGMFTTDGPPLAIYFGNKFNKQSFRATLNVIFVLNAVWINILYIVRGITTIETAKYAMWLLPALILGMHVGSRLHFKINEIMFKRVLAGILFVVGVSFII